MKSIAFSLSSLTPLASLSLPDASYFPYSWAWPR